MAKLKETDPSVFPILVAQRNLGIIFDIFFCLISHIPSIIKSYGFNLLNISLINLILAILYKAFGCAVSSVFLAAL